jgi:hypothetical protein
MRVALAVVWSLTVVLTFGQAVALEPLARVSLDEALQLALRENPTLRAQQFVLESTKAGQITAALRPNPTMNFLAEQFGGGSARQTQYTVNVGQPIELGGSTSGGRRVSGRRHPTPNHSPGEDRVCRRADRLGTAGPGRAESEDTR